MNRESIRPLVALSLIPQLGSRRIRNLVKVAGSAQQVFGLSVGAMCRIPGIGESTAKSIASFTDWGHVDVVLDQGERLGVQILGLGDSNYPPLLTQIADPPVLLWCRGDAASLSLPSVSIIGTRRPSEYGQQMAIHFARELSGVGLSVVSGLAYGVDAIAHDTVLKANGVTVGVLGSGIDRIYPGAHRSLAYRMIDAGGCLISEFPLGTKPDAGNFPIRNRVVSGLSFGTLVIETKGEGGSMITARLALDQNREVFAVPHRVGDIKGDGCNYLIQISGAKLVRHVDDILNELGGHFSSKETRPIQAEFTFAIPEPAWKRADLTGKALEICQFLANESLHADELATRCNLPIQELLTELLQLEFAGYVRTKPGKMVEIAT